MQGNMGKYFSFGGGDVICKTLIYHVIGVCERIYGQHEGCRQNSKTVF